MLYFFSVASHTVSYCTFVTDLDNELGSTKFFLGTEAMKIPIIVLGKSDQYGGNCKIVCYRKRHITC